MKIFGAFWNKGFFLFWVITGFGSMREYSLSETFSEIKEAISERRTGAYLCFDGEEVEVAVGKRGGIGDEIEMQEVLALKGPALFKSLHLPYGALYGMKWAAPLFERLKASWQELYAPIGPPLLSSLYLNPWVHFLSFLREQPLLFVGEIPPATKDLLFGPHCQIVSIEELEQMDSYKVILLGLDWRGKLLAKDLLGKGFFIDLGFLKRVLSEWSTEEWAYWIKKSHKVKILYTSALLPHKFEERKQEYLKSLQILKNFGFLNETYIVEACGYQPDSFFEGLCDHILYVNVNDTSLINKGVNEIKTLRAAVDYFHFEDDDMIVKLTGRYFFNDSRFLELVQSHPEVDAFASYWGGNTRLVATGCFALRGKYFKRMLKEFNINQMEDELIAEETAVADFLDQMENEGANVWILDQVGITANVANNGIMEQQ